MLENAATIATRMPAIGPYYLITNLKRDNVNATINDDKKQLLARILGLAADLVFALMDKYRSLLPYL